ncbi:xanthine dehydrogenase family protein molybdopterin-binding subunit [Paraglaciecola arctica]|uniref:Isoquinoline 1-oxidoreductase, beta subunit n=1 Tax=Paraglaciecola arctica BSs20135 TaxID=493475 RepID=K6ZAL5_9ALTE|nr:molybdopterin cofactor-binding domain-containing protein [Paraglaciecola arctica]GAC20480.1 isoquinoline 1-oxidoreductase, beta subunit [Paraglaciecola arctica BSs20135]
MSVSKQNTVSNESRRKFLKQSGLATGGLVLGISLPQTTIAGFKMGEDSTFNPNAFIHIADNGDTLIYCGRCEMGQGISTALPAAVADELEADWTRVNIKQGEGNEEKYGSQATGGSASIRTMYIPMREAGAAAKVMLVAAAAKVWGVPAQDCMADNHFVINKNNQQKLGYGELASLAANEQVPASVTLKEKKDYKYIGKDIARHNQGDIVVGKLTYGVDTKMPGLKYAAITHCPVMGGKLKSVDKTAAKQVKGVIDVIEIPRFEVPFGSLGGVAVVADNTWTAQQALKKLKIEWDLGEHQSYDTKAYKAQLVKNVESPAQLAAERGDITKAFAEAEHVVKATYTGGHLSHSPMEPNASVVWVQKDSCEVWAATQSPADIQKVLGQYLKREPKDIFVNVTMAGGAFGRKFKCDYVHEAAVLSQAVNAPVQLTWSREEDMRTGYYHSINAQHIEAAVDKDGNVTGWLHRAAFPAIASLFDPSLDRAPANNLGDVDNHPFGIANYRSETGEAKAHTRIGWYRAVYAIFYGFAFGSAADELAHKTKKDTVSLLNSIYDNNKNAEQAEQVARSKGALAMAAKMSNWANRDKLPKNQGLGIAVHYSFNTYVAMAVRVEVNGEDIKVLEVDAIVDCGQVLNTDSATAQMEGAVVMGMSLSLRTEVVFRDGAVVNSNFHNYPVLRINEMPQVNVHFMENDYKPTGLGEPGLGPFAPALANAVFAASGKRYRDLPFKPMSM